MKKTLILSCALALTGLSTSTMAAEGQGFMRGEIGSSNIEFDDIDSTETAYAVRGGYFFHDANIGLEGFYANYGEDSGDGVSAKLSGFGAGLVAKKSFDADNTGFYIDGRVGIARTKAEVSYLSMAANGIVSREDTTTTPYIGFGVGYDFSERFGLSVNYNYVRADAFVADVTAQTLTVGGEVRF